MSMDNIAHLGKTRADELVPSRYAVQVGDIEVLVISDGVLPITASTLATNAEPADLAAWLGDNFLPTERGDGPRPAVLYALGLVLRTSSGRIYPYSTFRRWLGQAGFDDPSRNDLPGPFPFTLITATRR
jgi:hypothetical protein